MWLPALILAGCCEVANAQYAHVSQLFSAPMNINPAFAGLQAEASATTRFRQQWPKLQNAFQTIQASGDIRFRDTNNGIGLLLSADQAGDGGLTRINVNGNYAYHLDISNKWSFSAGAGAGVGLQQADFDKLVFGDQITNNGYLSGNATQEFSKDYRSKAYLTVNAGGILYEKNFWVSFAGYQLNRPNLSHTDTKDLLSSSWIFTAGYKIYLDEVFNYKEYEEKSITPVAFYFTQGGLEQFNLGLYGTYLPLHGGVVYKGISLFGQTPFQQSLALLAGVSLKGFTVGYSYDAPLTGIGRSLGGAHEISLVFERINYNKIQRSRVSYKKYRPVPCPVF